METLKKVLNELYTAVELNESENTSEAQEHVDEAIELLSLDDSDYGTHMVSEELLGIISNLVGGQVEDSIYELEVIISEI